MTTTSGTREPDEVLTGHRPSSGEPDAARPTGRAQHSAVPLILRQALAGSLLAFVVLKVVRPIQDPDTFWHIEAGRLLSRDWRFVIDDPWGVAASSPWIFNQWLPQLLMSWMVDHFGLAGLAWLHSASAAVVVLVVWWTCRRRASMLVAAVLTALAFLGMTGSLTPRPQMVTFALAAVFADAWLRTAADGRSRWWLVALAWVWACSHGLWFLGGVIGLVVLTGLALDRAFEKKRLISLGGLVTATLAVGAMTPVGPRLLASPLQVSQVTHYINEWQPPSVTDPILLGVLALAAIPLLAGLRSARRVPWRAILLLGLGLALALLYNRTIAVAAAIIAPLAAHTMRDILPREPFTRREGLLTATTASVSLVIAAMLAMNTATSPGAGPNDLDVEIAALPAGTVLCNEQADGGWLIHRHPNVRITMDTRVEIYSTEHIDGYLSFVRAAPGWQEYPRRLGCEFALLDPKDPVLEALRQRLGWSVVAAGVDRVLLRANDRR